MGPIRVRTAPDGQQIRYIASGIDTYFKFRGYAPLCGSESYIQRKTKKQIEENQTEFSIFVYNDHNIFLEKDGETGTYTATIFREDDEIEVSGLHQGLPIEELKEKVKSFFNNL